MNARERAQAGLALLKEAIVLLLETHPEGLRNSEVADSLDIHSDYGGQQQDYLSWSLLGLLLNEGTIAREDNRYFPLDGS